MQVELAGYRDSLMEAGPWFRVSGLVEAGLRLESRRVCWGQLLDGLLVSLRVYREDIYICMYVSMYVYMYVYMYVCCRTL